MAKIIKLAIHPTAKYGFKKARKSRKPDLEELGQLNIFDQNKIVNFQADVSHFERALLLDESESDQAESAYHLSIKSGDFVADSWCNLGIIQSQKNKTIEAINSFSQALKNDPRHFEAHYNLANLYTEEGNLPLARLHYEVAVDLQPDHPNTYYNLALLLIIAHDYKGTVNYLEKYIDLVGEDEGQSAIKLIHSIKNSTTLNSPSHETASK